MIPTARTPVARSAGSVRSRRFSALEDAIAHAERPGAPMLMGFSLHLDGQLDPGILHDAATIATTECPMLAARRVPMSRWQRWPEWGWDAPPVPSIVSRSWPPGAVIDDHWPAILAEPLSLDDGPLVRIVHLQGEACDALLVAVHHAAVDGIGALMFLQHLAAAYSALDGSNDEIRVLGADDHQSVPRADPAAAPTPVRSSLLDVMRAPAATRVAPHTEHRQAGVGVTHRWVDAELSHAITNGARLAGVTVTDLLVAALHLTIADWNQAHGRRTDLVTVTVPVRSSVSVSGGDGTDDDPTTNRTLQVTTETSGPQRVDPTRAVSMVSDQLAPARQHIGLGEPAANSLLGLLPARWRSRVPAIASALSSDRFLASSRLSNLGVVAGPSLGFGAIATHDIGFSTPVRMPQGVTLGVVGYSGRLELALRWSSELFTATSAGSFADLYRATLARVAHT